MRLTVIGELSSAREGQGKPAARREQGRRPLAGVRGAGMRVLIAVDPGDPFAGSNPYLSRSEGELPDKDDRGAGDPVAHPYAAHAFPGSRGLMLREAPG